MLKEKLKDNDIPKAIIEMVNEELPHGLVYKKEESFSNELNDSIYKVSPENGEMKISINESKFKSYEDFIEYLEENNEIVLESKTLKINDKDFEVNDLIKNPITNEKIFGEGNFIFAAINKFKYTLPFESSKTLIEINGELTKIGENMVIFKGCDNKKKIFINYEINNGEISFKIQLGKLKNIDDLIYVKDFYESNIFENCEELKRMRDFYSKLIILLKYLNIKDINLECGISEHLFEHVINLYSTLIEHKSIVVIFSEDIITTENQIIAQAKEDITWVTQKKFNILGNEVPLKIILSLKENNLKLDNGILKIKDKKVYLKMCLI